MTQPHISGAEKQLQTVLGMGGNTIHVSIKETEGPPGQLVNTNTIIDGEAVPLNGHLSYVMGWPTSEEGLLLPTDGQPVAEYLERKIREAIGGNPGEVTVQMA
jgi:hypothetical protein